MRETIGELTPAHPPEPSPPASPLANGDVRSGRARRLVVPAAVGLVVFALYSVFSHLQWRSYQVPSWDLTIFTQAAQGYASWGAPIAVIKGVGYNLLGDHFHPVLVVLGPVYRLVPHAAVLLVVQNVLFAAASVRLTVTAMRMVGTLWGGLVGLAFGLSWGLQHAVSSQFHEIAFGVLFLTAALCSYLDGHWRAVTVWAGALVFVKEDLGLTVVVIGLLLAVVERRRVGYWLAAWGVTWFVVATKVVLPLLNPDDEWAYGSTLQIDDLLSDPLGLVTDAKLFMLFLVAFTTAAIAFRSPLLVIALPTLAWRFLSSEPEHWGPGYHYSAILMPVLFAAMLDGIRRTARSSRPVARRYAALAPAASVAACALMLPALPLGRLLDTAHEFSTERVAPARAALAVIPDGVRVESDNGLLTYLVDRAQVYRVGNDNPVPDYIVINQDIELTRTQWDGVIDAATRLHPGSDFRLVFDNGRFQVAQRVR